MEVQYRDGSLPSPALPIARRARCWEREEWVVALAEALAGEVEEAPKSAREREGGAGRE